jgi:hypothetical protein
MEFFTKEELDFYTHLYKTSLTYRKSDSVTKHNGETIKDTIFAKSNYWVKLVAAKLPDFDYEEDNSWNVSGSIKKYSWARLYLKGQKDKKYYVTVGVESYENALQYKFDCQRAGSKPLDQAAIDKFDNFTNTQNTGKHRIKADKLEKYSWEKLVDETVNFIHKHLDAFKELHMEDNKVSEGKTTLFTKAAKFPLNQILYGPPGTGKTFHTIDYAVRIANEREKTSQDFDTLRKAGQIEFITFHQNYTYEDFIGGIRPDINSGNLRFDKSEGVFKQIADRARKNWESSQTSANHEPDFDTVFQSFFSDLITEEVREVEIPMSRSTHKFKINNIDFDAGKIRNFVKQSGGTSHDLLISNIKGLYNGSHSYSQDGLGIYYHPLVEQLKEHAKTLSQPNDKEELKNFVVIIDEINRANISRVFGELITLLEDDKRMGAENELRLTLPNKEEFALPPNLYVIGTMNTADKSIALLDIALRRRFEFVSFYPTHDVLDDLQSKELLTPSAVSLLKQINQKIYEKRKSADFLVGHAYFIRKQDSELATVLRKKVVPLLMEYFSGKTEEVSKIFEGSPFAVSYDTGNFDWSIN